MVRVRKFRRASTIGACLGVVLILAATLLVAGILVPALPYVGILGTALAASFPGYVWLALIVGSVMVWLGTPGRFRAIALSISALAAVGLVIPIWALSRTAGENGVKMTGAEFFGRPTFFGTSPADEFVTYTKDLGEALTARIYRPRGAAPAGGWPTLVYVHGGGWIAGTNEQRSPDWRWFTDQGWMVVSVAYSLSNERRHLWDRVTGQLGCALTWTAANIGKRGGNIDRLALLGDSAGGNLVLNVGYLASAKRAPSSCGGVVPTPRAVVAVYPGVDLVAIHRNSYPWIGDQVREMVTGYTGGTPEQFPQRYAAVASASYIRAGAPRTLIFITESDHLVPVSSMQAFEKRAKAAGIDVRSVKIPYGGHVFDAAGIGNAIFREASLRFLDEK